MSKINSMQIPLFHVNAFTDQPFRGNPAAVCLLDSWLDDEALREVAAENNLPATAFLVQEGNSYHLRWFTPQREVRLCGHATLATAYVLLRVLSPELGSVRFETRFRGQLTVEKKNDFLAMDFPGFSPQSRKVAPAILNQALGLNKPLLEVAEANEMLLAALDSENAVKNLQPDFALLERLHPCAVIVTAPANDRDVDFVSRYFAPSYGVPEDPVTGSAHCVLAPYWANRLNKSRLHARQLSHRTGELWCEIAGERVILEGKAVLTMRGTLTI
jgi:PhzF family phenazine biosynthesis protein